MPQHSEDDVIKSLTNGEVNVNSLGTFSALGLDFSGGLGLDLGQSFDPSWAYEDGAVGTGQGDDWEDTVDQEIGDEDEPMDDVKEEIASPGLFSPAASPKPPRRRLVKKTRTIVVERKPTVRDMFPTFNPTGTCDFTELFKGRVPSKSRIHKARMFRSELAQPVKKPRLANIQISLESKAATELIQSIETPKPSVDDSLKKVLSTNTGDIPIPLDERSYDPIVLDDWEDQIIYDRDTELKHIAPPATTEAKPKKKTRAEIAPGKDKFNLSNDHFYEVSKERQRVRQTFGNLVVQHAYPALKLQLPFYKTRLTKEEARAFHRPALQIPANIEFRFTRVRNLKKKKDKNGRRLVSNDVLKKTGDLTLKDNSNFVLWEYSEEHPPVLSNFGMGSVLVNYYRKKDEKDDYVPKGDLGEPFVLEANDESPFFKYGSIQQGQTIPAMYNNLVRAPLFKHTPPPTDFLVIKSTTRGESKYYIRDIKHLYVSGQTFPVVEVPGPHSRKITHTIKQRLIIIACKLLSKSKHERLKISRLMKYFPDQNELQMRQRLKAYLQDFMEYHRRGEHQTFWRLKTSFQRPSPADMLKMVEPEHVVLSESMIVGQRHLLDSGYGKSESDVMEDEGKLDTEQQLAPWITTKNFIHATQGKAMLKLHGEGDPTGRGEGFSFIRVSMKEIFVPAGEDPEELNAEANSRPKNQHRYNVAQQQQVYKSEIERIWRAQFRSLSNKTPPELTLEEANAPMFKQPRENPAFASGSGAAGPSNVKTSTGTKSRHSSLGATSRASSIDRDGQPAGESKTRVLRIRRQAPDGSWTTEIVRNDNVISAYVARRVEIEEENMRAEDYVPTGDVVKDQRMKAKLLEQLNKMKKNQERRLNRKNAKAIEAGEAPLPIPATAGVSDAPGRERRCGNCGQLGHMKTNRKCPRWAEFNQPAAGTPSGSAGSPPQTAGSPPYAAGSPNPLSLGLPRAGQGSGPGYYPSATSPLATSPPITADEPDEYSGRAFSPPASTPTGGLKLKLSRPNP
ncbi:transcription initiation factor TFIID subunit D1 [Rhizoctonia solani AG-1 IB]|uniref:Transcription initiation factor TFIID subunit D1 n=1 Tax=Thanatephorus cucumeris (strain AG1-IB / isolate 7/3/14) TaxID=1108050 RepID=A0A0B7F9T4_THACB|nr:transcription initiation factor TFIID subunit D1 [Rhizoctonia solani AG-1 IB]